MNLQLFFTYLCRGGIVADVDVLITDSNTASQQFSRAVYSLVTGSTVSVFGANTVAEGLTIGQETSK
jgi:hypothetical protein